MDAVPPYPLESVFMGFGLAPSARPGMAPP
jgi:hypothetical protein